MAAHSTVKYESAVTADRCKMNLLWAKLVEALFDEFYGHIFFLSYFISLISNSQHVCVCLFVHTHACYVFA